MKKVLVLIVLLVAGMATTVNAQKFGHIDIQQLITVMPERQSALETLEKEAGELENMLASMQQEYQSMINDFTENQEGMSDLVRQAKGEEIQLKGQRIETFRVQADQQLQQKQQELMVPIFDAADKAISDVAKEQSLIYVFDISSRVVLYQSPQSLDVLPLVKKKLGIE